MPVNPFVSPAGELATEIMLNIAEMLTLKLPEGAERIIASKWVKKFLACDPKAYKHNLSLFISCLTKQLLVRPFDEPPTDMSGEWRDFDREYSTKDINAAVIQRLYRDSFTPPYKIDISHDMREYVAYQEIPFFGAHLYYAFSPSDTIERWTGFNKLNVPKSLAERLWKEHELESPIKGRFLAKGKSVPKKKSLLGAKKTAKPKPAWQGAILEEEEEEVTKSRLPMVSIPVNDRVKNLPPALQRRMLQAEKEKKDRLEKKEQEKAEKSARLQKPQTRFGKSGKKLLAVKKKPAPEPVIEPPAAPPRARTPEPEFTGPNAHLERRLYQLRKSNPPPPELIQTTRDMNVVSRDINTEAERLARERIANLDNVERLHVAGVSIGNRVLKMMRAQQAEDVQTAAAVGYEAVQNVKMTMDQLNAILSKKTEPKEDTLIRLAKIKESMASSAAKAESIVQQEAAKDVVNALDQMVEINEAALGKIKSIEPKTQQEAVLIEGLENENRAMAENIKRQSERLATAINRRDLNTSSILQDTMHTVDEILEMSFKQDEEALENVQSEAAKIQQAKNQQLEEIRKMAAEIDGQVESSFRAAASNRLVARHLHVSNDDDEIIDINTADMDLGATVDEDVMQREALKRRKRRTLVEVDASESLMDVSAGVMEDLEESIEIIEEGIREIQGQMNAAESEKDREALQAAVDQIEKEASVLHEQLESLQNAMSSETLVP